MSQNEELKNSKKNKKKGTEILETKSKEEKKRIRELSHALKIAKEILYDELSANAVLLTRLSDKYLVSENICSQLSKKVVYMSQFDKGFENLIQLIIIQEPKIRYKLEELLRYLQLKRIIESELNLVKNNGKGCA